MKKRRRILRTIGIIILVLVLAVVMDAVYIATRPDIPPFDDSALALDRPKIPDSVNGAILLEKAIAKIKTPREKLFEDYDKKVKDKRNPTEAETAALKTKYGGTIEQIRQAVNSKGFQEPSSETPSQNLRRIPVLTSSRSYAQVNSTLAWGDLRKGDYEAATQRLRTNYRLANAFMNSGGGALCFILGTAIEGITNMEINAMMDENLFSSGMITEIHKMLDEEKSALSEGLKIEAKAQYIIETGMFKHYFVDEAGRKDIGKRGEFNIKLTFRKNKTNKILFDFYKSIYDTTGKPYADIKVADANFYAPYKGTLGNIRLFHTANYTGVIFLTITLPNMKFGLIDNVIVKRTENELLKTKAAISLYRMKYGKPPEKLDELVPEFIGAVPADPFDGKSVRYDRAKGVVYSVGYNLKDDGGAAKTRLFAEKVNYHKMKDQKDIVAYLSGVKKK